MKRFRIFGFDFDARVHTLTREIQDHWEEQAKEAAQAESRANRARSDLGVWGGCSGPEATKLYRLRAEAVFDLGLP